MSSCCFCRYTGLQYFILSPRKYSSYFLSFFILFRPTFSRLTFNFYFLSSIFVFFPPQLLWMKPTTKLPFSSTSIHLNSSPLLCVLLNLPSPISPSCISMRIVSPTLREEEIVPCDNFSQHFLHHSRPPLTDLPPNSSLCTDNCISCRPRFHRLPSCSVSHLMCRPQAKHNYYILMTCLESVLLVVTEALLISPVFSLWTRSHQMLLVSLLRRSLGSSLSRLTSFLSPVRPHCEGWQHESSSSSDFQEALCARKQTTVMWGPHDCDDTVVNKAPLIDVLCSLASSAL